MDNRLISKKSIVCLGGGIGTVNLLKGLKTYTTNISTIISMADNGGSSGRLRRLYNMIPVGDMISCIAAMSEDEDLIPKLLTYRFEGERYGKDHELGGHKLGNLIMVALKNLEGNYENAIEQMKKIFNVQGNFLPATEEAVDISAITIDDKEVFGEEKIDLGKYKGKRILKKVILHPENVKAALNVVDTILKAEVIVLGPGDLYTNLLPILIVPDIKNALKRSTAKKILIINTANKPFETKGYFIEDYLDAIERHIGDININLVLANNNFDEKIPAKYHYTYVKAKNLNDSRIILKNLAKKDFPIHHDSKKLAKEVVELI